MTARSGGAVRQGGIVEVRGRPWLVEAVNDAPGTVASLSLACISDDAQCARLEVIWEAEIGASVLDDDGWESVGEGLPDEANVLAAHLWALGDGGRQGPYNRFHDRAQNGWALDPPDLIIQDELHLISGPLGTVAGLYEAAIDQLATREKGGKAIRPKIVASTATVRRASAQIEALFDRTRTAVFPPPGLDRTDSFFARAIPASREPARLYVGIAAQGRGPSWSSCGR